MNNYTQMAQQRDDYERNVEANIDRHDQRLQRERFVETPAATRQWVREQSIDAAMQEAAP